MDSMTIRNAAAHDAAAIADIYNHYIRSSTATFDTVEKTTQDRFEWLESHDVNHPVLVAEQDGLVIAWGAVTAWAIRPAWGRTVEISVYVRQSEVGAGVGPRLVDALVERARQAGHHALVAQIVADNRSSLKMAERAGFERVGTLKEVGYKFQQWLDVALVERILDE